LSPDRRPGSTAHHPPNASSTSRPNRISAPWRRRGQVASHTTQTTAARIKEARCALLRSAGAVMVPSAHTPGPPS
jgi:hypothetical protein